MKLNQDLSALVKGLSVGFQVGLDNSASYWDNNTMNFGYELLIILYVMKVLFHSVKV